MFTEKELGDFELGLMALGNENQVLAEDFFTALQVAFTGKFQGHSVGDILNTILPPGRSDTYKAGYCPPYSETIFAVMDSLFHFAPDGKPNEFGDYQEVLVTRRTDQLKISIMIKVPMGFGSSKFQNNFESAKYEIEKRKKDLLAKIQQKGDHVTDLEHRLLQRLSE